MRALTRRDALRAGLLAAAATLAPSRATAADVICAGLVVPRGHRASPAVRAGAEMSAREAERAATLMGAGFRLLVAEADSAADAPAILADLKREGARFFLGGVRHDLCAALGNAAPEDFLAIQTRSALAPQPVSTPPLSVTPTYAEHVRVLVSGLKQLGLKRFAPGEDDDLNKAAAECGLIESRPEDAEVRLSAEASAIPWAASVIGPLGPGRIVPLAWHGSLQRYGAAQLNDRFGADGMDEDAWYGWMAVKLIAEAALRGRPLGEIRADGHKGRLLMFKDGVLQQPLYVAAQQASEVEIMYVE